MTPVDTALAQAVADLNAVGARYALVGGVAVGLRSVVRFTRDLDFAVAVPGDQEAEAVVFGLRQRGYSVSADLEQTYVDRLCTIRLLRHDSDVIVDLLFANCGLENDIVDYAENVEVIPGVYAPVARTGHLIAMKALAGRNQDLTDLEYLFGGISDADLALAREAAQLIVARGYSRGQDVPGDLEHYIREAGL